MKACVIAETSAAARALCAGARGMADEVVLIAPGVEALTGVADKAVHIDVPSGNAIDDAYASVNSVVDAEAPGIVLVEPTRSMKVLAGRLAAHLGTAAITDVIEFEGDLATTMYFGGVGQRKSKASGTAIYTVGAGVFDEASASGTDAVEEAPFAAPARALRVTGTKDLPKSDWTSQQPAWWWPEAAGSLKKPTCSSCATWPRSWAASAVARVRWPKAWTGCRARPTSACPA